MRTLKLPTEEPNRAQMGENEREGEGNGHGRFSEDDTLSLSGLSSLPDLDPYNVTLEGTDTCNVEDDKEDEVSDISDLSQLSDLSDFSKDDEGPPEKRAR